MIEYGKRLVRLRGEKSQSEVAKGVGISTSALAMYETQKRMPRDSIKIAIANYFGCTVQSIFFDQ